MDDKDNTNFDKETDSTKKHHYIYLYIGIILIIIVSLGIFFKNSHIQTNAIDNKIAKATDEYQKGNYQEAIKIHNEIIEKEPTNLNGHTGLGWSYYKEKNPQKALQHFKKAKEMGSSQTSNYEGLGYSYYRLGEFEKSAEIFKECKDIQSTDPCIRGLGYAYTDLEKYELAIETLKNITSPITKDYNFLGLCYYKVGEYEKSLESLNYYLKENPSDIDALIGVGKVLYELDEYNKSKESFNKAEEISGENNITKHWLELNEIKIKEDTTNKT